VWRLSLKKSCEESLKDVVGDYTLVWPSFTIAKENIDWEVIGSKSLWK
jgi:hypothetical protein